MGVHNSIYFENYNTLQTVKKYIATNKFNQSKLEIYYHVKQWEISISDEANKDNHQCKI